MKASELIKELEKAIEEHGDCIVEISGNEGCYDLDDIYFEKNEGVFTYWRDTRTKKLLTEIKGPRVQLF